MFLDRDGVIVNTLGPGGRGPRSLEEVSLADGLEMLSAAIVRLQLHAVVVTNQPDISRGLHSERADDLIWLKIKSSLPPETSYFRCPHTEEDGCRCRKPLDGLLKRANNLIRIPPSRSVIIGDRCTDVFAGRSYGCSRSFLIGKTDYEALSCSPDYLLPGLEEASLLLPEIFDS